MKRIIWSPTAQKRIKEILDFISIDNPTAALSLIDSLEEKVESLKIHPEAGRILPELDNPAIRELVVHKNYGVIYEISQDLIEILTVRHFKRNFSESDL